MFSIALRILISARVLITQKKRKEDSMFCEKCGKELFDEAVVCPSCGVPTKRRAVTKDVPNHMVGAVLTTIFCCLIGGIVAIIDASKVNTKLAQGDVEGAVAASNTANNWIIANIVLGLLGGIIQILAVVAG